ncbi:hypothetical protein [Crocosphaera chwakensis]|uniref:Uncharacterized protein n=1 Tax=Crocosphaera chwakensis CCY0110 TaxID=391612 RepID=A3IZ86_9CHRO|nr:hypothetical protein [Crocosphaera chwakensis]EAZ88200.1 hypothetical protein CY0110_08571 [Crocosphaera chwakensis CCY0110]
MFGRQPKEENIEVPDVMFPSESEQEEATENYTELSKINNIEDSSIDEENPEVVTIVEKISGIVSPYFIVVVGLILSDDNFFLGLLLIAVGILSLLKISLTDIVGLFIEIKEGLTSDD